MKTREQFNREANQYADEIIETMKSNSELGDTHPAWDALRRRVFYAFLAGATAALEDGGIT